MQYLAEKEPGPFMFRRVEEYGWFRAFNDVALIHEDDAVGDPARKAHFMGHADHGHPPLQQG